MDQTGLVERLDGRRNEAGTMAELKRLVGEAVDEGRLNWDSYLRPLADMAVDTYTTLIWELFNGALP